MKRCNKCGLEKDENDFHRGNKTRCKECANEYGRQYYRRCLEEVKKPRYRGSNQIRAKAAARAWAIRDAEKLAAKAEAKKARDAKKVVGIYYTYGMTLEEKSAILSFQGNACAICKTELQLEGRKTHVDHDHKTGAIRGLLCNTCNTRLGWFEMFQNDPVFSKEAMAYLDRPPVHPGKQQSRKKSA